MKSFIKRTISNLRERYKVLVLKDSDFIEKLSFKVPAWVFIAAFLTAIVGLFFLFIFIIKVTPLKEYVIGDGENLDRKEMVEAFQRIDSLERASLANERYLSNLKNVMAGTVGESIDEAVARDSELIKSNELKATHPKTETKSKARTEDEEVLKSLLELNNPVLSKETSSGASNERGLSEFSFYSPVRGVVTSSYEKEIRHLATDIATKKNDPIQSILDGHVIFASFTPATGYVIIIQHDGNLLSVYKHCSALLKREGSFVKGGEVLGLVGSTGELSTGPHLHFELWYNGNAVNAEDYINF